MRNQLITNNNQPLHPVTLASIPTLNATSAYAGVSKHYSYLSTGEVLQALMSEGLQPYSVALSRTKIEDRKAYVKHSIRLRHSSQPMSVGGLHPEIVVTNSHDGGSSFQIELGIFRLVCSNGLVISSGQFQAFRIRHVGSTIQDVLKATKTISSQFPNVLEMANTYSAIQLTQEQRLELAHRAMGLRWSEGDFPFPESRLLSPRRLQDESPDLWTTFNVIQENLTRGQKPSWSFSYGGKRKGSRAVSGVDASLRLNRELWGLLETTAQGV